MTDRVYQVKAKVLQNIAVGPKYYKMALACAPQAQNARPGQFVMVRLTAGNQPLLRRPFGIHRVGCADTKIEASKPSEYIEILYEVVGKATEILAQKSAGEYLDIIGPLGNGFDINAKHQASGAQVLVAGGMGVAPLLFLAEKLTQRQGAGLQRHKVKILIGAKTKSQIICEQEFKKLGCEVSIATDDGSKGFKGRVTDLLTKVLSTSIRASELASSIYACGPRPMLKEICRICVDRALPAQVSLEEHMACGIGACLGCVTKVKSKQAGSAEGFEYLRVCKDGPVFTADALIWEEKL